MVLYYETGLKNPAENRNSTKQYFRLSKLCSQGEISPFFIDDTFFLMTVTHEMHVKPSYFALLKSGDKLIEFRLNDTKRQKINAGDKIKFICQNGLSAVLVLSVSDIVTSSDFSSLLKKFPQAMLGGISYEEQLSDLRNFYNMDSENKYGAIAIVLKGLVHEQ